MTTRPNVVVILADDLGWGDLGCYGATLIATPRIDALAADGVRFTDAHAASSVCTPSRYALLTGRYSWRSPLKKGVLMGHGPALIEPDRSTVASAFGAAGYRTAAIGKWHLGLGWRHRDGSVWSAFTGSDPIEYQLGDPLRRHDEMDLDSGDDIDYSAPFDGGPTTLGFDRFFGIAGSLNMPPYAYLEQDRTRGIPDRPKTEFLPGQRPGFQAADWDEYEVDLRFTDAAVDFIAEADRSRPFLLYFTPSAPHRPQVPPAFLRGASDAGARGDAVAFVDWMVGRIVDALADAGVLDDTIVVFSSDNGAPLIFDDEQTPGHSPNGPWRGQKGDVWEGGHREPLIVRWPAHVPRGAVVDSPIGLIDLFRTLASLAGVVVPDRAAPDGVDRADAVRGRAADGGSERLRVHSSMGGALVAVRGRWKAAFTSGSGGGLSESAGEPVGASEAEGQLFDLDADPLEQTNLWDSRPEIVASIARELRSVVGGDVTPQFR